MKYDICIVGGAGHIGLPLGLAFAQKKLKVVLYDTNTESVGMINDKIAPFYEEDAQELLSNTDILATTDPSIIRSAKFVIITIGTPVDEYMNAKLDSFRKLFDELLPNLNSNQIIVIRSTVYPGTSEYIHKYLYDLTGKEWNICYCPERISQGNSLTELVTLPQIISSTNSDALIMVRAMFEMLSPKIIVTSLREAELVKLFCNAYRYMEFAIANQFYSISNKLDVDFNKVRDAMITDYPRAEGLPKAGLAAGPCLFKDTMQLFSFDKGFHMGWIATAVNEGFPNQMVDILESKTDLIGKRIGVLGMTFKANIDDIRDSLSFKLVKLLEFKKAEVFTHDPFYKDSKNWTPLPELMSRCDIIIVAVEHDEYKALDTIYNLNNKIVINTWK